MDLLEKQTQFLQQMLNSAPSKYEQWFNSLATDRKARIEHKTSSIRHGLTHIAPLTCQGPRKCPFFAACPIPVDTDHPGPNSDYPLGMGCVLEVNFVAQKVMDYLQQLQVDPYDPIEMSLVNELALIDLMKNRATIITSVGDSLGQGRDLLAIDELVDAEGGVRHSIREHPVVGILDKLERRRNKLLDKMMATRESKLKLAGNMENHTQLMKDMQALRIAVTNLAANPQQLMGDVDEKID